jgi:glycosyltransferase involved in cell wall biosynthesis
VCAKKNQLALIEQLPALFDQTPQAHLHFVGDFDPQRDSYARRCEAAVNSGGLAERVTFHGYSTRIGDWYRAADCVLLASRREGLARCMIEALACGTPVVSFDVTSAHEILDRCGPQLVAPQGDYARLFAALGRLAEDPDARAKIGRTGAELARRRFSAEAATTQFAQLASRLTR